MNFRHCWNHINLSRPMNYKGINCWFGVGEQRMPRPLWEIRLWSCPVALNANYEAQKRSETKPHATDSAIHHAMLFDLKRLFFINNFEIVSGVPTGENMLLSSSPLHKEVTGCGFSALLAGTSTGQMLNFSWAWAWTLHTKESLLATILPFFFFLMASYLILKGYFSLIFISICTLVKPRLKEQGGNLLCETSV